MIRNHVTQLKQGEVLAKQSEDGEQKAKAEAEVVDPTDPKGFIARNTKGSAKVDGNGSGIAYTTGEPTQEAAKKESEENAKKAEQKVGGPNPNTVLDSEEKRVQAEGKKAEAKKEEDKGDKPAEEGLVVSHPAASKDAGGKEVESVVDPKVAQKKATGKK